MFSYLQMPFLQALGYAIANSLWQIFLLWMIAIFINNFIRHSSHVRYVTALSAQVAGFVWFLTTLQFYYRHCEAASVKAQQLAGTNEALYMQSIITGNNILLSFLVKAEETLPYLSVAYLILLTLLAVKWIQNFRFTKQLAVTGLHSADTKWQIFVNEMTDRLGIIQDVKIYLSSIAKSPLTIGYIKPIILLPVASINCLTTEQLEAVLLHELTHIQRADYIVNILISIAEIVLFFNPFTRLLSRTIQKERENCCDDWVLQYQYDATMYAEALLKIATLQHKKGFQMNAAGKKGDLLQRIKRMVQPAEKRFSYKHQLAALILITGFLFSLTLLQPTANSYHQFANTNETKKDKKIVVTPLIVQVDNPFFNGASLLSSSLQKDVSESLAQWDDSLAEQAARTGIEQAQVALTKSTPALLATISSGNWQKLVKKATEEAGKSLQNVDWQTLHEEVPSMPDTDSLLQSVNMEMIKADQLNGVKQDFAAAKEELAALQKKKTLLHINFTSDYLKQLSSNALASLQNIPFTAIQDSILAASQAMKNAFQDQKRVQEEIKIKQLKWLKKMADNDKIKPAVAKENLRLARLTAPPLPPSAVNFAYSSFNEPQPPVEPSPPASDNMFTSAPVFNFINAVDKATKTIHIISNTDIATINIVIEIRQ